ncbi:uncharacterized protein LOC109853324 isoform X2 [Pseudomyrmex gracilis]|uniref:uncharacterized protein LOC109853324 isoform X2 n=1 Tax=Pseudomyrmex gracilis TaxID=219809 RepID=UPI0009950B01|nr:uncharacterized protein LOC109853324 isoform X2 [Pseudomyrmex gracilis]
MENQNDKVEEQREIVTLILKTKEFKIDKQKLIDKSRYFAALLSASYIEFGRQEHVINYEIPLFSFEEFIYWISDNRVPIFETDKTDDTLEHLLTLLELSVLFAVDDLIQDVTDVLETDYLLPKHVIDVWLVAQELCINVLRDVCLAVCLDRFTELPISSICQLSKKNFLKLVGNVNVRTTESYLFDVTHQWMRYHEDTVQKDLLNNKQPRILNSIISCENLDVINSTIYLHCWDGNNFYELTTFKYPREITNRSDNKDNRLTGMQIAARGYHLYLSGGEFGIGSGKFNIKMWRYSLISKRWLFQTNLPNGRRHMVATFIKNKLFLVGGVGRYRRKLKSVDIYNIHTDIWTKGPRPNDRKTSELCKVDYANIGA